MKYKGIKKIYFGVGIRENPQCFRQEMYFYFFYLKQRNPEGEMLKSGRDYIGFNLYRNIPFFGINY